MQRSSGILLHPTALPGPFATGDLGKEAFRFVDFLAGSGQSVWQVLPLGPTGYGHSPYNALSAFAGNPALIDLTQLVDSGDLSQADLDEATATEAAGSFNDAHLLKAGLLSTASQDFFKNATDVRLQDYQLFCQKQSAWLDGYALFMALRNVYRGKGWQEWPVELKAREPRALSARQEELAGHCQRFRYEQYIFTKQWQKLKSHANQKGIRIFGDIPIFVAHDSADVWANQKLFQLDNKGQPTAVAGVPPDYFSKTGQRWGNPLYRWQSLIDDNFDWWLKRFAMQLQLSDMVRIDHFRGFEACWSIPASEPTAVKGHWEDVPGRALFTKLREEQQELPIIAEDLGIITPEVERLRDDFGFPGMKILQFAFDSGPDNPYLPENHIDNCVVYTGTHDNNTTLGWWRSLAKEQKDQIRQYFGRSRLKMPWDLIELAMSSVADLCIIPAQDILSCTGSARFNTPGHATGNWSWQAPKGAFSEELTTQLYKLTKKHQRISFR